MYIIMMIRLLFQPITFL